MGITICHYFTYVTFKMQGLVICSQSITTDFYNTMECVQLKCIDDMPTLIFLCNLKVVYAYLIKLSSKYLIEWTQHI